MIVQALALRPIFEGPSAEDEGGLAAIKSSGRAEPVLALGVSRHDTARSDLCAPISPTPLDTVRERGGDTPTDPLLEVNTDPKASAMAEILTTTRREAMPLPSPLPSPEPARSAAGLHTTEVVVAAAAAAAAAALAVVAREDGTAPARAAPSSAPPPRPSEVVRIRVGTWNMGAATPDYDRLGAWLGEDKADLYAVGVQECRGHEPEP